MKTIFIVIVSTMLCCCLSAPGFAQQSTIDVVGMHQLIDQSKDEHTQQISARNNQATVNVNEQANLTLLEKLKNMYRTLQERYNTLGTAINVAEIGIYATPVVEQIVSYQGQIVTLAEKNPAGAALGISTEIEF